METERVCPLCGDEKVNELRAEVERLRSHWQKVIGFIPAPGQEVEVYETLSATVERYAADNRRLRPEVERLRFELECTTRAYVEADERSLRAQRLVAERQREACADSLRGTALDGLHMRVRTTPLVTEGKP